MGIKKLIQATALISFSSNIFANEPLQKCEVKIGERPTVTECFNWKTSAGQPVDVDGKGKKHLAVIKIPGGKEFTLVAKHHYLSSEKGIINSSDLFVTDQDMTYAQAVSTMEKIFEKTGLYKLLSPNSLKTISEMKRTHGDIRYPRVNIGDTYINMTVKTLSSDKGKDPNAKVWCPS